VRRIFALWSIFSVGAYAQTEKIDENKMFSDGDTVTPIENITDDKLQESTDKESVAFSGRSTAVTLIR
jgi:hypothetical protein